MALQNYVRCLDLHSALFEVLDALVHVVRHLLPDGNAQLALEIGGMARLRGEDGAQRVDLLLNAGQFLEENTDISNIKRELSLALGR